MTHAETQNSFFLHYIININIIIHYIIYYTESGRGLMRRNCPYRKNKMDRWWASLSIPEEKEKENISVEWLE